MNNSGNSKWESVKAGDKIRVTGNCVNHSVPIGSIGTVKWRDIDSLTINEHYNTLWYTDVEPYYSFNDYLKEIER